MRFFSIRNFSIVAFLILIGWEMWKAFVSIKSRNNNMENVQITDAFRRFEIRFDDSILANEHLLTNNPVDVKNAVMQRTRKKHLTTHCHQRTAQEIYPANTDISKGINPKAFKNIIVNDKHQLLYCKTPKVATTNWKRVLLVLDGYFTDPLNITASLAHDTNSGYFRQLSDYTPDEINLRLTTYYKFLFARHPFERLVSAFKNKFSTPHKKSRFFRVIFGRYIMKKYRDRENVTLTKEYKSGTSVTFDEFVRYIVDSPLGDKEFWNEHWERIDRLCLPCLIQYDFIGKFETLRQDADYLLRTLDVADAVQFPAGYYAEKLQRSRDLVESYFKTISNTTLNALYEIYKIDFLLFDYDSSLGVMKK